MIARLATAWRAWVALWAERASPLPLALFRIAVGLVSIGVFHDLLGHPDVADLLIDAAHGGLALPRREGHWVHAVGGATPDVVAAVLWFGAASSVLTAVGLGGRWPVLGVLVSVVAVDSLNQLAHNSADHLLTNLLFLLALGEGSATLSVDAWWRTGRLHDATPRSDAARRLIVAQLVILYATSASNKLGSSWWWSGGYRMLYHALLEVGAARADHTSWVPRIFPLTQVGTVVSWWWELGWCVLGLHLIVRRVPRLRATRWGRALTAVDLRVPFVALGAITHGTLWLLVDVEPFSALTLSAYLCLLRSDDGVVRRLDLALRGGAPDASPAPPIAAAQRRRAGGSARLRLRA